MSKITYDHGEIKKWAEKYHGIPELIDHNDSQADAVGIRINFPGNTDDVLFSDASPPKEISWDEFFKIFDERGLAMEYNSKTPMSDPGYAYKFLNRKS